MYIVDELLVSTSMVVSINFTHYPLEEPQLLGKPSTLVSLSPKFLKAACRIDLNGGGAKVALCKQRGTIQYPIIQLDIIDIWEERKSRLYGDVECAQQPRPHSPTGHLGEIAGVNGQRDV